MQYILNETEFQAFQNLKEENAKLSHKLAVAIKAHEMDRRLRFNDLVAENQTYHNQIAEIMRDMEGTEAQLRTSRKVVEELEKKLQKTFSSKYYIYFNKNTRETFVSSVSGLQYLNPELIVVMEDVKLKGGY